MRELETEFEGKVDFVIVSAEETQAMQKEVEDLGLGSHGLVGTGVDGEIKATLPGHSFGREEIVGVIEKLLL